MCASFVSQEVSACQSDLEVNRLDSASLSRAEILKMRAPLQVEFVDLGEDYMGGFAPSFVQAKQVSAALSNLLFPRV